jgi:hypothetical protein
MKLSIILLVLFPICAWAADMKQPRNLGNTAVMHLYYYAPKTLEVTYVDSYLFKDEGSCKSAIPKALQIATVYASEGDLVSASCVGMTPPEPITKPNRARPENSTTAPASRRTALFQHLTA